MCAVLTTGHSSHHSSITRQFFDLHANLDTFPSFCALVDTHALHDSSIYREVATTPHHLTRKKQTCKILTSNLFAAIRSHFLMGASFMPPIPLLAQIFHPSPPGLTSARYLSPITSCQPSSGLTSARCSLSLSFPGCAPNTPIPGWTNPLLPATSG